MNTNPNFIFILPDIVFVNLLFQYIVFLTRRVTIDATLTTIQKRLSPISRTARNTGKPFNDASGRRLRSEWYRIPDETFYNPENFYIVSIAHCYPGKASSGGDRRPPRCCADKWLTQELTLVQNEFYILIGGYAAAYLFPGKKLTDLVFQDLEINGKKTGRSFLPD